MTFYPERNSDQKSFEIAIEAYKKQISIAAKAVAVFSENIKSLGNRRFGTYTLTRNSNFSVNHQLYNF
ncbi:MAG TPA: hypothetical protein PLK08_09410, partial [Phycisphaerae bacterium]|nr:hypothetical protein [Phycisphaerae bacterium]